MRLEVLLRPARWSTCPMCTRSVGQFILYSAAKVTGIWGCWHRIPVCGAVQHCLHLPGCIAHKLLMPAPLLPCITTLASFPKYSIRWQRSSSSAPAGYLEVEIEAETAWRTFLSSTYFSTRIIHFKTEAQGWIVLPFLCCLQFILLVSLLNLEVACSVFN